MKIHLLFISCLCLLSKVHMQYCQTPCYCPWLPPRCPPGSHLVLDGCGCCNICARRLGEPCNHLHVCDKSQGLACDYSASPLGRGGVCNYEEGDDDSCEVNGKTYQDGEVFQPTCKLQCRCSGGGFTCVPLCSEDVRLPTPDCPYPRRVEIPGKCCQEWICERQDRQNLQDKMAAQRLPATGAVTLPRLCEEWSTEWSACSTSCGIGIATRVSNVNPYCRLEMQRRLCSVRPCQGFMGASSMVYTQSCTEDETSAIAQGGPAETFSCTEEEETAYKVVHIIQKLSHPYSWTTTGTKRQCFCDSEITIPKYRGGK